MPLHSNLGSFTREYRRLEYRLRSDLISLSLTMADIPNDWNCSGCSCTMALAFMVTKRVNENPAASRVSAEKALAARFSRSDCVHT